VYPAALPAWKVLRCDRDDVQVGDVQRREIAGGRARPSIGHIPIATLHEVPGGHGPWLVDTKRSAELIQNHRHHGHTRSPRSTCGRSARELPTSTFTQESDRVRDAYGDSEYRKLVTLKDTYNPANLFRLNQNIRLSQQPAENVMI